MAELIAAITAITTARGVVSSIFTFGDVGWRIIKRVNQLISDAGDVPEVLADIKAQLPLLIEKMDELKSLGEERLQKIDPQSALAATVTGCRTHIDRLENLVNKIQPRLTDSLTKKGKKASQSMFYEDEIAKILIKLECYRTSLILHFTCTSIDVDKVTTKDEAYYMVPGLQVSGYVGRIELLESVKSAVQQDREQQQRQVVVLFGMGGQGKSQLAMEYCRTARLSKEFRAIFWIDASSIKSVHRSFERIASKIDPSRIFENIEAKVAFVKDTMDGWDSRWLLVFDNYDAPSTDFNVAAFFPTSPFGTILVTSRHEASKRLGKVIPLAKMTAQESLELLFIRSESAMTEENMATGRSIVAKLGFLPLAIDQAGAFISALKLPLTLFLERFDSQKEEILKYIPEVTEYRRTLGDDEKETALNVFTTWELSFQQIGTDETGEIIRSFLTTAAFFNTRDIGEDLFHRANDLKAVPSWINAFLAEGKWDGRRYRKVLGELSKLSLLNFTLEDMKHCRFYLHPLVADWLRLRVSPDIRRLCTIESCYLLANLIADTDLDSCSYTFRLYLLGHLDECLNNRRAYSKPFDEEVGFAKTLADQFGTLLQQTSRFRAGISLVEEALLILKTAYGKEDGLTRSTTFNLGNLYSYQWKLAKVEAEQMYVRDLELAGYEKALGKGHALTLNTVDNLGTLYFDQGKLAEAEEMYVHALVGKEKALGKDHASTLNTINNLGVLYCNQGKLGEAEEMYVRVLAGKEKTLGKDHALTLNTVHNLGTLYFDQGKLAKAEEMYMRALAGYEKALGKDHASTLKTLDNLGTLYFDQGKLAEAEEMYVHALVGKEKALGKDHASTLNTINNLGVLYCNQGKLGEAEEMYVRVLVGKEKTLGKDHALTLNTVHNLGTLYFDQGKLTEAKEMYMRALVGYEKALGKDHASTLKTLNNLGTFYFDQGKLAEAEEMYVRALAGCEKALGKDHGDIIRCVQLLSTKEKRNLVQSLSHSPNMENQRMKEAMNWGFGHPDVLTEDDKEPAMMNEEYDTVAHKGISVAEKDARKFIVTDIDYESSSIVRTPHKHGRDGKLQDFVKDFITEINRGESGYSFSKAWLVSLEAHDKETVLSVLLRAGYIEFHQTGTAIMYRRIEDNAEVPTVYNQLAACTTEKLGVSYDDIKQSLASNDYGDSDEIGEEGYITETQDGNELGSASQMERSDGLDSEMSTVSSSQKKIHVITVQADETSCLCSPWSLSHKGNAVVAVADEKLESFKTALKDTGPYGYAVSTEWLSTLSDHEVEDLKVVLWKAGYLQMGKTNTTTYFKRHGHVHNKTGSQRQAPSTHERNALGDRGSSSTSQCTESGLPEKLQDLNMEDTEVTSEIQEEQRGHVGCQCLPQYLTVTCQPPPEEASISSSQRVSKHSTRQSVSDCHVTMPKYRSQQTMNTEVDKIINLRKPDFDGKEPCLKLVSLHVSANTRLTCCVTSDQNDKKVRFEFHNIEGVVQTAESGQMEESMDEKIIPLVLRAVRTNVYAYTTRAERSEHVPLRFLEPERFQSIDRKGQTRRHVLKKTAEHPKNHEPGSSTIELQYSDRATDCDVIYGNYELMYSDDLPVVFEGDVPANLNQNLFLELEVRYQLEICYFEASDSLPPKQPFVRLDIVTTRVDFDCMLEFKCKIT